MKTTFFNIVIASLLVGVCIAADDAKETKKPAKAAKVSVVLNLITNPSFEDALGEKGLPKGWGFYPNEGSMYKAVVVDGGRKDKKALQVEGQGKYAVVVADRIEIMNAAAFLVRGWVKVEGEAEGQIAASAMIKFDYMDAEGKYLTSTNGVSVKPGGKWQEVSVASSALHAKGAKFVAAALVLNGKGKAHFDDLEMIVYKADPNNLAGNGGFETVAGDKPIGWSVVTSEGDKAAITVSKKHKKQGFYGLGFKGEAEWAVAVASRVPFDKSKSYSLSSQVKSVAGDAGIKIDYFNGDEYLGSDYSQQPISGDWEELSVSSSGEYENATHLSAVAIGQGKFEAYFDDMVLKVD
jgi:hypothetical protein